MCISPCILNQGAVACRYCWQCRDNRINDWVGRAIAEQKTNTETYGLDLTYSGDGPETAILRYSDIQDFMKRLRRRNPEASFRYIVAGEYGEIRNRAHWHMILFVTGKMRDKWSTLEKRENWSPWGHGFVWRKAPHRKALRYALKYALKNHDGDGESRSIGMSKKPPLGYDYFQALAKRYVEQDISPQSPAYRFSDNIYDDGTVRTYWLQGRSRELFIDAYLSAYKSKWNKPYPFSQLVLDYEDQLQRQTPEYDEFQNWLMEQRSNENNRHRKVIEKRDRESEVQKLPHLIHKDGWSVKVHSNGRYTIYDGDNPWHAANETELERVINRLNS